MDSEARADRPWTFYVIWHEACGATYAGVSPDVHRRLRQHNGELVGGAKYTTARGPGWRHVCFVRGFRTKQEVLQFEWAVKHEPPRRKGGLEARIKKLTATLNRARWTSNAPPAADVALRVELASALPSTLDPPPSELPDYVTVERAL